MISEIFLVYSYSDNGEYVKGAFLKEENAKKYADFHNGYVIAELILDQDN